jgi:hypothetical protein
MESVLSSVIWRCLSWQPRFLLRRFFLKEWLVSHISINIRPRHNPEEISQPENPCVRIYPQVEKYLEGIKPKIQNEQLLINAINALYSRALPAGTLQSGAH